MTRHGVVAVMAVAGALGLASCAGPFGPCAGVLCDPCDDSVTVHVKNARTELPVETATAAVGESSCQCAAGSCTCFIHAIGTHAIAVSANGYESATATVSVPSPDAPPEACCVCPEPSPRQQTLLLVPL